MLLLMLVRLPGNNQTVAKNIHHHHPSLVKEVHAYKQIYAHQFLD